MEQQVLKKVGPMAASSKFGDYLKANFLVWAFLAVLGLASFFTCGARWDDVTSGILEFLFLVIGGGVGLVSGLDYFYDKCSAEPQGEKQG